LIVVKRMSFNNGKWKGSDQIEKSFFSPGPDCTEYADEQICTDCTLDLSQQNCVDLCKANAQLPFCKSSTSV
jgi:hypothetical protein